MPNPVDLPRLREAVAKEHELKCWPEYFAAIRRGDKTFEVRKNDRGFKVGDTLWLREWSPTRTYTGAHLRVRVTYTLEGPAFGIEVGYIVMGLDPPLRNAAPALLDELEAVRLENKRLSDFMTGRVLASPDHEYYDRAERAESELAALKTRTCAWVKDDDGIWQTACGNEFWFDTDGPTKNGFAYCPYCGAVGAWADKEKP
jgi:hypothetical protein